jgi:hypothetical protein
MELFMSTAKIRAFYDVGFVIVLQRNRQFEQQCVVLGASDRLQSLKSHPASLRGLVPRLCEKRRDPAL